MQAGGSAGVWGPQTLLGSQCPHMLCLEVSGSGMKTVPGQNPPEGTALSGVIRNGLGREGVFRWP